MFETRSDYVAFEKVLAQSLARFPAVRLCAYCVMPNHFHLVLWPRDDDSLSRFMQWLTTTHTQRWHAHRHRMGRGHLYQGRFKSFPIEQDHHFLAVCRYVERNALRAGLSWSEDGANSRVEHWPWASLSARADPFRPELHAGEWPVERPTNWIECVNQAQGESELVSIRQCIARGNPYGSPSWTEATAKVMGLESSLRPIGRPRKVEVETLPDAVRGDAGK